MSYDPKYINSDNGFTVAQRIALLKTLDGTTFPNATPFVRGGVLQAATQADSTATTTEGVVADLNSLLAKLKAAGIMV